MQALSFPSPYRQGEAPYDIFQNRMTAITSIITGVKGIIANKYINNQLNQIADGILNQVDENKANELINLINEDPPEGIYPSELEKTIGQFVDKAMGKMAQKEQMMGTLNQTGLPQNPQTGLPQLGQQSQAGLPQVGLPQAGTQQGTSETMIPKGDMFQLYNAVKSMDSGQVNWANLFKTMTAKKPYFMGTTGAEEFVMNQMQTQIKDPREEMSKNIDLAAKYKEAFYPEEEGVGEVFDPNQFKKDHPDMEITGYNSNTGGYSFSKKEGTGSKLDMDKLNEDIAKFGLNVTGMSVNPTTGNVSYSLGKEGMSFEEKLDKGINFVRENPEYEISSLNSGTGNVSITKISTGGTGGTNDKVILGEANFAEKQFEGVKTNAEYDKALAKVRQIDQSVIVPSKIELFEGNYNFAINYMRSAIDENGKIKEGVDPTSKSGLTYEQGYSLHYNYLEQAINEYRIATGETLDNPFVSFEEYKKMDTKKTNLLHLPSTLGQQRSVFKSESNYKDGEIKVISGKKLKYDAGRDAWEKLESL